MSLRLNFCRSVPPEFLRSFFLFLVPLLSSSVAGQLCPVVQACKFLAHTQLQSRFQKISFWQLCRTENFNTCQESRLNYWEDFKATAIVLERTTVHIFRCFQIFSGTQSYKKKHEKGVVYLWTKEVGSCISGYWAVSERVFTS